MRKQTVSGPTKPEKAIFSLKKILVISLIFILCMGMCGAMATSQSVRNVKITLSSGYEMSVITTSKSVKEILKENHVVVFDNETVIPDYNGEITAENTITITKEEVIEEAEKAIYASTEEILQSYTAIVEKIVTVQEEIPYETITKDDSNGSSSTTNRVIQSGSNGIKEVTYKIRYQNGNEIDRTIVSEKIIKDPVDKIVQVSTYSVTSRGSAVRTSAHTWTYDQEDLYLLYAITAQECSSSYEGALAVITCACNRAESSRWSRYGSDPLSQYTAPNQFCYSPSVGGYWQQFLGGNVADYVVQAVQDALNGKRNHSYLSFRAAGYASGENIGGNVYFSPM